MASAARTALIVEVLILNRRAEWGIGRPRKQGSKRQGKSASGADSNMGRRQGVNESAHGDKTTAGTTRSARHVGPRLPSAQS
jgi:hypothetical protein